MVIPERRYLALTWLILGAVATGAGDPAPALARNEDADPKPAAGRMFVTGRVLDPTGRPVPGATVALYRAGSRSG